MVVPTRGAIQLFLFGYSAVFTFQAKARMWMVHVSMRCNSCSAPMQDTEPLCLEMDIRHFIAEGGYPEQSFRHRGRWFLPSSVPAVPALFLKIVPMSLWGAVLDHSCVI